MKLLDIHLTAKRGNWSRFRARSNKKGFIELEKQILERDKNTCRYCGFMSEKYQQVVNINQDYGPGKSKPDNLATACLFCTQCFFLDGFGQDKRFGGSLVYLPEISQADVNHFCRVLFASMLQDAPYKGKLQTTYLSFKDREQIVNEAFGPKSSDPGTFAQTLLDSNLSKEQMEHPMLQSLRLLPDRKHFVQEVIYWKQTVFEEIPL